MAPPAAFVPLLSPPDTPAISGSRWFAVRRDQVAISDTPPHPDAPSQFLGMLGTEACWAADVDGLDGIDDGAFTNLYGLFGRVDEAAWAVAGRAVQLVAWARTHRYCGACGTPTELAPGERAMRCPACRLLAFPRLAPAVIVVVSRGRELLLARGRTFPVPMYSAIAGFVEPGETLEQAVHREVGEEVGVEIEDVRYLASQPWPFPHSLMVGFTARWVSGDIVIDEHEIVDAQWFPVDALPAIPPGISIARRLIDHEVARVTA